MNEESPKLRTEVSGKAHQTVFQYLRAMIKVYWILVSAVIAAICSLAGSLIYELTNNYSHFEVSREDSASSGGERTSVVKVRYSGHAPVTDFEVRLRTQFFYKVRIVSTSLTNGLAESLITGKSPCQLISANENYYAKAEGQVKWFSELYKCNVLNPGESLVYQVVQSRSQDQQLTHYERAMERAMNDIAFVFASTGTTYSGSCSAPGDCISGKGQLTNEVYYSPNN